MPPGKSLWQTLGTPALPNTSQQEVEWSFIYYNSLGGLKPET
jgi:hypothetical protein